MQYLRARYYEAESARFTSQDTYGGESEKPLTQNRYLYANGDPVNFCDPGGQAAKAIKSSINSVKAIIKPITVIKPPPEPPKTTQIWKPSVSAANGIYTPSSGASSGGQVSVLPAIKLDMQVQTLSEINRRFCSLETVRAYGKRLGRGTAKTLEAYIRDNMPINDPSYAAIQITVKGNVISINTRIHVIGNAKTLSLGSGTYGTAIKEGLEKVWSGSFKVFGFSATLVTRATEVFYSTIPGFSCPKDHLDFVLEKHPGRAFYLTPFASWNVEDAGERPIHMYPQFFDHTPEGTIESPPYTREEYMRVAAHEFGHALGVWDAYVDVGGVSEPMKDANGKPIVSIFSSSQTNVQNRDVEMVLLAHHRNTYQYWT